VKHRTALVTALSIAGVLLAGVTALAANLGILDSASGVGELSAVAPVASSTAATDTPPGPPVDEEVVAYRIPDVGVVTLVRRGDGLTLLSVAAGSWSYRLESEGTELTMTFALDDRRVVLMARVDGDRTLVDVVGPPATGGAAPPETSTDEDGAGDDD
jgi:hypothetical protein